MHASKMEGQSLETVEPNLNCLLKKTTSHSQVYKCIETTHHTEAENLRLYIKETEK